MKAKKIFLFFLIIISLLSIKKIVYAGGPGSYCCQTSQCSCTTGTPSCHGTLASGCEYGCIGNAACHKTCYCTSVSPGTGCTFPDWPSTCPCSTYQTRYATGGTSCNSQIRYCGDCPTNNDDGTTATNTPTPSATVTITPTTTTCTKKNQGDANCDGTVNLTDFEIWRSEFIGGVTTKTADFNSDSNVNLTDFEIWRATFTAQ